jgi:hypothetical protein
VSADGSVTTHSDVTDAGSGAIITSGERTTLGNQSGTNTGDEVQATESVVGISERATQAETHTGTDDLRHITPAKLAGEKGIADGIASLNGSGVIPSSQLAGGGKSMILSFGSDTSYEVNASGADYTKSATFIYAGSTTVGAITMIRLNAWVSGTDASFRIYDATNALVIAEITGVTSTDELNVVDMGTLSNIPTASAIFEVQIKRDTGGSAGFVGSIELGY